MKPLCPPQDSLSYLRLYTIFTPLLRKKRIRIDAQTIYKKIKNTNTGKKISRSILAATMVLLTGLINPGNSNAIRITNTDSYKYGNYYISRWTIYANSFSKSWIMYFPYEGNDRTQIWAYRRDGKRIDKAEYREYNDHGYIYLKDYLDWYERQRWSSKTIYVQAKTPEDETPRDFLETDDVYYWEYSRWGYDSGYTTTISLQKAPSKPVPESNSLLLFASGAGAILPWTRKKKRL